MALPVKILLISFGDFSGAHPRIATSLRNLGHDVAEARASLRDLTPKSLYVLRNIASALSVYGWRFNHHRAHTYSAYVARSKASQVVQGKYRDYDVVIQLGGNSLNFWPRKQTDVRYMIITDHTNLLSKKLPESEVRLPERETYARWNELERSTYAQQDHVFSLTEFVRNSLIMDYGVASEKVSVIGAGPSIDVDIERDRETKEFSSQNVLFVGKDAERKGLQVLRRAFAQVVKVYPKAVLHIVGVKGLGSDNEIFYGRLNDNEIRRLYYRAQVFALPSFREPLGFSLLEAMWSKTACIGTRVGGIQEVIEHGRTGYLIEPGDDAALANHLLALFRNRERMEDMAESGYRLAKLKWSWAVSAEKISEVLCGSPSDTQLSA